MILFDRLQNYLLLMTVLIIADRYFPASFVTSVERYILRLLLLFPLLSFLFIDFVGAGEDLAGRMLKFLRIRDLDARGL